MSIAVPILVLLFGLFCIGIASAKIGELLTASRIEYRDNSSAILLAPDGNPYNVSRFTAGPEGARLQNVTFRILGPIAPVDDRDVYRLEGGEFKALDASVTLGEIQSMPSMRTGTDCPIAINLCGAHLNVVDKE